MLYALDNRTRKYGVARTWKDANGTTRTEAKHKGDDYAETYGHDPVYAVQPGRVSNVGKSSIFGFFLWVRRDAITVIRYHMFKDRPGFLIGQQISPGRLLGYTGASAANASGNHIHIQAEVRGIPVDPRPYISGWLSGNVEQFDNLPQLPPPFIPPKPKLIELLKRQGNSMETIFRITSGATGKAEAYRSTGLTFDGQCFIQESANGPLLWIEHRGILESKAAEGYAIVDRTAIELRDFEIQRYGHQPIPGGPISHA